MGYQETFLRIKSTKFFDACIDAINSTGKEYYEDFFQPVVIFTFKKDHKPFKKGEKAIYFVGDRSGQRSVSDLLGCSDTEVMDECNHLLGFKDGIGEAIFTEEVNPKGIFADSGKVTDVEVEPFEFSEPGPFSDAESCLENFAKNIYEETPEEEQKFVSKKILKSSLYKKYEEFRDYLISKDFGILHGPRDSFTFKVLAPILFDEEEFLQKLNESGFALVNVLFPEEELDRYIFVLRDKDNILNEEDGNTAFTNPEYDTLPIEDFKEDVENAYKENSELTDEQQENMKKTVSLVNCLLDMGITIRDYYYDVDDDACTYLWAKISKQIDFNRLKNAVIEAGYGIKDWTNWDDMYAFLPGIDLEFFLNTDDDYENDYFENYDENVKKALTSAEAHLNEFLADSSIQVALQASDFEEKRDSVPPKLVYQMNAMCKELATLGCMIKLIRSSDSESGDEFFFNLVDVKTSGKIDFNKFRDILKKYSFYISNVHEGTIRLESLWDISECNIFWYC